MSKYPKSSSVVKVIIESHDGTWVLKKRSTILEWCEAFSYESAPKKVEKKIKKITKKKAPVKKAPKPPVISSDDSEEDLSLAGTGSGSNETNETDETPETPGGYAKMRLNYKVVDDDPMKAAQKMAKSMKGKFVDH